MPVQAPALAYCLLRTQSEASSNKVCHTRFPCQGKNNAVNKLVRHGGLRLTCEDVSLEPSRKNIPLKNWYLSAKEQTQSM